MPKFNIIEFVEGVWMGVQAAIIGLLVTAPLGAILWFVGYLTPVPLGLMIPLFLIIYICAVAIIATHLWRNDAQDRR